MKHLPVYRTCSVLVTAGIICVDNVMTNRALGDLTLSRNPGFNHMVTPESYVHQHMLLNLSPKSFNWSDQLQNMKMFSDTHFKIKSCIDSYRRPQRTPALGKGPKMR